MHLVSIILVIMWDAILGGSLVTTAWRVLRLRMERIPPSSEGSSEYTEKAVADSRQGVVLQLGRSA